MRSKKASKIRLGWMEGVKRAYMDDFSKATLIVTLSQKKKWSIIYSSFYVEFEVVCLKFSCQISVYLNFSHPWLKFQDTLRIILDDHLSLEISCDSHENKDMDLQYIVPMPKTILGIKDTIS